MALIKTLGWPLGLPELIYSQIAGKIGMAAEIIYMFGGNILLYSVPVYLLLTCLSRYRRAKNQPAYSAEPPAPPERF